MEYGDIVRFNGNLGKVVSDDKGNFLFHPVKFGRYYYHELEVITDNDIKETTTDEKIEYLKQGFAWGKVIDHSCLNNGEYVILKYIPKDEKESISYHPYLNFKDTDCSYYDLDSCLVGVIALKHDGANTKADRYFMKMIKK